jgi:hypothetical protein
LLLGFAALLVVAPAAHAAAASADYVIAISVDGLGSGYLQTLIDQGQAPNFQRFQKEGAWTNNARADRDVTVTLPNHTSMITGRGVRGASGHNYTSNTMPAEGATLHGNKGSYLASVFDVAHDNGLRTCLYAGKKKFILFARSYDAEHGAADAGTADHGRAKIDSYVVNEKSMAALIAAYVAAMKAKPFQYSFIHFADTDSTGHQSGWGSKAYNQAVCDVDKCLADIFQLVEQSSALRGRTVIILTADHGGKGHNHADPVEPLDYTIPFYVWGAHVPAGRDLYALNPSSRLEPGTSRPTFSAAVQPIRNGEVANLSLALLGLGPVPGSTIDARQDLVVTAAAPANAQR